MPPTNNKTKLQKIVPLEEEDFATPEDLIKMSEALMGVINRERDRINALVADESSEKSEMMATMNASLDEKEKQLKFLISELGRAYADNDDAISTKFSKEVARLEKKIPSRVDLTGIFNDIQGLKDGINSFPTELTMNNVAVRDGLELLQGDERLDRSAIKGLEDWEEIGRLARKTSNPVAGAKLLANMLDVAISGIANGQGIAWNAALGRFEPITLTGGSGTVTTVSVVNANGFNATVANPTTAPAITLKTTVTGLLKGNGTAISAAVSNTDYQAPISLTTTGSSGAATFNGTTLNIPQYAGGGTGITRSVASISTATTLGAAASTDYVALVSGITTITLPTAVGNTNMYTIKRVGTNTVTIATTSAQTIDGSATASLNVQYQSLDLVSDGASWNVV